MLTRIKKNSMNPTYRDIVLYSFDFLSLEDVKNYVLVSKSIFSIFCESQYYRDILSYYEKYTLLDIDLVCKEGLIFLFKLCIRNFNPHGNRGLDIIPDGRPDKLFITKYTFITAIDYGHTEICKILLSLNLDILEYLEEFVMHALDATPFELVKSLLDIDIDNQIDKSNILLWAIKCGRLDVFQYLESNNKNIVGNYNDYLYWACFRGHLQIVEYLVTRGADISYYDHKAIKYAVDGGHIDVVKYLAERGEDTLMEDNYLLKCAMLRGHLEIVKYLENLGGITLQYHEV